MIQRHSVGAFAVLACVAVSSNASALEPSKNGPLYVQGTVPLGLNFFYYPEGGGFGHAGWRPDVEFGAHITGRHDGPVVGFRQGFLFTAVPGRAGATTALRYGYDIPIPIGDLELNIAPFGTFGLGYTFDGPSAGIAMSWGVDTKLFITSGFYAFVRPFEMGFQCAHDSGNCGIAFVWGAGVGFAFPEVK